jgi:hypothetical protein
MTKNFYFQDYVTLSRAPHSGVSLNYEQTLSMLRFINDYVSACDKAKNTYLTECENAKEELSNRIENLIEEIPKSEKS